MRVPVMVAVLPLLCAILSAQQAGDSRSTYGIHPGRMGAPGGISASSGIAAAPFSRGIFFTGRVLLSDGSVPSERIAIQRVCGMNVTNETVTDAKGRFSFQLGSNRVLPPEGEIGETPGEGGFSGAAGEAPEAAITLRDCDLRAALPGYRSDTIPLSDRRPLDNPNVGTIILHPLNSSDRKGMTVSATTALAPGEARKDYGKGMEAVRRNRLDEAQKDFKQAVDLFPKFAAAWFELGNTYELGKDVAHARECYSKSIEADTNYIDPYERLYLMDLHQSRWQEAADGSGHVLGRNPYDFSSAYYVNAVANLELHHLDAAEKSARAATELKGNQAEPRATYVLGFILAEKGEFAAAAESLRAFLKIAPQGEDRSAAERMLAEVEKRTTGGEQSPARP